MAAGLLSIITFTSLYSTTLVSLSRLLVWQLKGVPTLIGWSAATSWPTVLMASLSRHTVPVMDKYEFGNSFCLLNINTD